MNFRHPVLLYRKNDKNPFNAYFSEILAIEGYFSIENLDLTEIELTHDMLKNRPLVISPHIKLNYSEIEALKLYVKDGGNLIISRPPIELADLFGIKPVRGYYSLASDCYIVINNYDPLMRKFPVKSLQFFGDSEVYEPARVRAMAWLSAVPHKYPNYVSVGLASYGKGKAAFFSYDLSRTIVTLHQGLPENASTGPNANADRSGMYKTTSLHIKVLDERQKMFPQADLHQDILVRLIREMTSFYLPLPRVWHFPKKQPAIAFLNGDSDGMALNDLIRVLNIVEKYGAHYTVYLMKEHIPLITPDVEERMMKKGHGMGVHPWVGPQPSLKEMSQEISSITKNFEKRFGFQACSTRTHSVIWVGWVDSARFMKKNGLKMDTSFTPGRYYQEGFLCGSGLPFKFVDEKGQIIDFYEQATLETDDGSFTSKTLLPPLTQDEAVAHSLDLIEKCYRKYHCVYHPYFHPISTRDDRYGTYRLEKVLEKIEELEMITVSDREWIDFNEARRALKFQIINVEPGKITYLVRSPKKIKNVTIMFSPKWNNKRLKKVMIDNQKAEITNVQWEGDLEWALITATFTENSEKKVICEYVEISA